MTVSFGPMEIRKKGSSSQQVQAACSQVSALKIDVFLYATLSKYLPEGSTNRSTTLNLPEGSIVQDIIEALGVPEKTVKLIFINGCHARMETPLSENDRIGLFPPVGGG